MSAQLACVYVVYQ